MEPSPEARWTLYTLYLPVHDNDGAPLPADVLQRIGERIARYTGGFTLLSPSTGMWIDAHGAVCRDLVTPLLAVAAAGLRSDRFFSRLAADIATELQQREIFVHCIAATVVSPHGENGATVVPASLAAISV